MLIAEFSRTVLRFCFTFARLPHFESLTLTKIMGPTKETDLSPFPLLLSNEPLVFSPIVLMTTSSKVEGFWLGSFMAGVSLPFKLSLVRRLTKLIQAGVLSTEIARTCTLDQIQDAVKATEDSSVAGKVLLRISGSP